MFCIDLHLTVDTWVLHNMPTYILKIKFHFKNQSVKMKEISADQVLLFPKKKSN